MPRFALFSGLAVWLASSGLVSAIDTVKYTGVVAHDNAEVRAGLVTSGGPGGSTPSSSVSGARSPALELGQHALCVRARGFAAEPGAEEPDDLGREFVPTDQGQQTLGAVTGEFAFEQGLRQVLLGLVPQR